MKCPSCGKENRDIALYCQFCGGALAISVPPEQEDKEPTVWAAEDRELPALIEEDAVLPADAEPWETTVIEIGPTPDEEEALEQEMPLPIEPEGVSEVDEAALPEVPGQMMQAAASEESEQPPQEDEPLFGEGELLPGEVDAELEDLGTVQDEDRVEGRSDEATEEQPYQDDQLEVVVEAMQPEDEEVTDALVLEESVPITEGSPGAEAGEQDPADGDISVKTPAEAEHQGEAGSVLSETAEQESEYDDEEIADVHDVAVDGLLPWSEAPEPMVALTPGTVVRDRYLISEMLSDEADQVLYRVRDLNRCMQCGSAENSPNEAFCASCGAALDQKPVSTMLERTTERDDELDDVQLDDQFSEGERFYWVWREAPEIAEPLTARPNRQMLIGQRSHTGQVRELDEDSMFALVLSRTHESVEERLALFIVADGMGGHEGGEIASRLAIQTFAGGMIRNVFTPALEGVSFSCEDLCAWMVQAMEEANDRVYLARQKHQNDMGTTMTAALIKDWTLCLAHVGDCRAYRWGEEGLEQLTTDHSIVASMIAAGTAEPEEIYTHPQRSMIYRCIGDVPTLEVETSQHTLSPDDRLILCCDGLWEMIRDEGIEESMLREVDPQAACGTMVDQANIAGGTDNISVIVIQL